MVSTKNERMERAWDFLSVLVGSYIERIYSSTKRPSTLPCGINYTNREWMFIREAAVAYRLGRDVSIQILFELKEIENKYQNELFLANLHK